MVCADVEPASISHLADRYQTNRCFSYMACYWVSFIERVAKHLSIQSFGTDLLILCTYLLIYYEQNFQVLPKNICMVTQVFPGMCMYPMTGYFTFLLPILSSLQFIFFMLYVQLNNFNIICFIIFSKNEFSSGLLCDVGYLCDCFQC